MRVVFLIILINTSHFKKNIEEVKKDISTADQILQKNLGRLEKIISYPYGESSKSVQKLVQKPWLQNCFFTAFFSNKF